MKELVSKGHEVLYAFIINSNTDSTLLANIK